MLATLLTEITALVGHITVIKEYHLIALPDYSREETRRRSLVQIGKQH